MQNNAAMLPIAGRPGAMPRRRVPSFYTIAAIVLFAVAVLGFSNTVPFDLRPPGLPLPLKLHAAVFLGWIVLSVAQPVLVGAGSVRWHRRLGWVGCVLAAAMFVLGTMAVLGALRAHALPPFYPPALFLVRGTMALLLFPALITAAVVWRRRPEWHKRLMLAATTVVCLPGLERALPVPGLGPHWYVVVDAIGDLLLLALVIRDLARRHAVHPATLAAIGAVVGGQAVVDLLAPTALAASLAAAIAGG